MSLPLKVLYDAIDTTISLELTNGEVYTGTLVEVQDTMNVLLKDASKTSKSGNTTQLTNVLLRGASIVFFQLPDSLKKSPALVTADKLVPKSLDARGGGKGFAARSRARKE